MTPPIRYDACMVEFFKIQQGFIGYHMQSHRCVGVFLTPPCN